LFQENIKNYEVNQDFVSKKTETKKTQLIAKTVCVDYNLVQLQENLEKNYRPPLKYDIINVKFQFATLVASTYRRSFRTG